MFNFKTRNVNEFTIDVITQILLVMTLYNDKLLNVTKHECVWQIMGNK